MASFSKGERTGILHEQFTLTLGTLATLDVISGITKIDGSRNQGFRVLKTLWTAIWGNSGASEGPIYFGLALNNSATEIEEALEADPQGPDDFPAVEQSMRPVWPLGLFTDSGTDIVTRINDGKVQEINLRWSFSEHSALSVWAMNLGGGTLTTGSFVTVTMKHFGVWLDD